MVSCPPGCIPWISTGIADTAYFGAEAEFYVFDDVRFDTQPQGSYYFLDSIEAKWNSGRKEEGGNQGYKTAMKGGYFPVPPVDHFADLRDKICLNMKTVGLEVERAHHEVGSAGQQEINYKFNTLLQSGDDITATAGGGLPTGETAVSISGSGDVALATRPANLNSTVSGSGDVYQD